MNGIFDLQFVFAQRAFTIPDYQRGYAWDEPQWRDLREDLTALPLGKDHFTGTIVLCRRGTERRKDNRGNTFDVFDVVDGQQRLTTLVVLLDAIRRAMLAADPESSLALGLEERFLRATSRNGQPFYKLRLNEDCRDFFERNVLGDEPSAGGPGILSHRRLAGARRYFDRWIEDEKLAVGAGHDEWLIELYDKVTEQLKVSVYQVADEAEVGVIFEVMNDRGKPLSELEKVKNFLLYLGSKLTVNHDLVRVVNTTWRQLLERLMQSGLGKTTDEDRLLRFHWLTVYDHNTKSWVGSRSIKGRFRLPDYNGRHEDLLGDLLGYVRSLGDAAVAFCDIYRPDQPASFARWTSAKKRAEVVRWSQKLLRMGTVAPFIPLLVATRLKHPDDHTGYVTLLRACELYGFRVYRHAERRANAGVSRLYNLASQVHGGSLDLPAAAAEVRTISLDYCSRKRFDEEFEFEDEGAWYWWGGLRYFLYEYEEHLAKGKPVALEWDVIDRRKLADTVEHILPQTHTKTWADTFDEKAHKDHVHDIGNLCLTYDNSSYGNKAFAKKKGEPGSKKPCYVNSSLRQERELAEFEKWNKDALFKRRKKLVKWAKKRWALEEQLNERS